MTLERYEEIIDHLVQTYGLAVDRSEHETVTEFYEGPIPVLSLIMSHQEDVKLEPILIVSFHIELDAPAAIQWYLRIREQDPNLHLSSSYLRDANGASHEGEDAEVLRMHMIEQDLLSVWVKSEISPEEVLEVRTPAPSPIKHYNDYKKAFSAFNRLKKSKKDTSH